MVRSITLADTLEFEWDEANLSHIKRHGVEYQECEEAFYNRPFLVNNDEKHSEVGIRFQALGQTNGGRKLFIVFTIRREKVRVVSTRDQNRKEKFTKGGENI